MEDIGRYLNVQSVHPDAYKSSDASLFNCANRICSKAEARFTDLDRVRNDLSASGLNGVERRLSSSIRPADPRPRKRANHTLRPWCKRNSRILRGYDVEVAHVPACV